MADNAALVRDYIETVWNQGRTAEGPRFLAADLAQHNPYVADGSASVMGFVQTLKALKPQAHFAIRRLAAEGDLVFVHSHLTTEPDDPGTVVVDVFRLADGLIVEHWDVAATLSAGPTASGRPVV